MTETATQALVAVSVGVCVWVCGCVGVWVCGCVCVCVWPRYIKVVYAYFEVCYIQERQEALHLQRGSGP